METNAPEDRLSQLERKRNIFLPLIQILLLLLVLAASAYLRTTGMNWDENQHLHPDERFLTMVETGIEPVKSLSEYFNTQESSLNPHNRGFGFFVYGTLPIFIVRYIAGWLGETGYDQVFLVGRYTSAVFDLLTVLVVFLAGRRLFRSFRIAILGAAFYGLAVLPIQLSHYFAVDTFLGFFGFLSFYFAVLVMTASHQPRSGQGAQVFPPDQPARSEFLGGKWWSVIPYVLFGIALGMAAASKVSAAPLAVLLPAAAYLFWVKLPPHQQNTWFVIILRNLVVAAFVFFVVFRICQPYAFTGPGFFGLKPNENWVSNMKELSSQSTGDVDFPPALQWARRPITFAWQNMVRWGFGYPLGLMAWAAFAWMTVRIFKGEWQKYLLLWGWTLIYFTWQEVNFTRSMRYQILVYPTLAIIAAWGIVALWDYRRQKRGRTQQTLPWTRALAALLAVVTLAGTAAWAFAFTGIYNRPMTRVAASRWIYQNVPSAINVTVETEGGLTYNIPLGFRSGFDLISGDEWVIAFRPQENGRASAIFFSHAADLQNDPNPKMLTASIKENPEASEVLTTGYITDSFLPDGDSRGKEYTIQFQHSLELDQNRLYYLSIRLEDPNPIGLTFSGPMLLNLEGETGLVQQPLPEPVAALRSAGRDDSSSTEAFTAEHDGKITSVFIPHVVDWEARPENKSLILSISDLPPGAKEPSGQAVITGQFPAGRDPRGQGYTFTFDRPVEVKSGSPYYLHLAREEGGVGRLAVYGSKTAVESTWDDPLPLPMDGFSPFDINNGLYRTDLNFEMYWDDSSEKLTRFVNTLNLADYIFITSNRQWGTTVRVPERYPLTSEYYRQLIGCPEGKEIIWCYATARPGSFVGNLGYELVSVFQSNPKIGPFEFNTQFAEEAFTVYDHPKVLIFKKSDQYQPGQVREILSAVNLDHVVHLTPRKAGSNPGNLLLPEERLAVQRAGGTWSDLFDTKAIFNQYPGLGLVLWYLVITLLGWVIYPYVRLALRGLPDRGYPLSKMAGLLLLAYFSWLAGSAGIPVTRLTISIIVLLLTAGGLALAYLQRDELAHELRERRGYFLAVELVALSFFAVDLIIRLGNPDLWHPYKGGEKPMDFSYFNAVIKSTTFPPYDPWFAGGYINYYYFGFVIAGIPVKWLGIVPAVGYNLVLPTFFSLLALGAFSFGWNVLAARQKPGEDDEQPPDEIFLRRNLVPLLAGLGAAVALVILGNWGTVRMIWHGMMRLVAPDGLIDGSTIFQKLGWTFKGFVSLLAGSKLPYGDGDWYWIPSRVYPHSEITEFPFFTFLYADPHAHLFALPLTLLALSWALSVLLGRWRWGDRYGRRPWLHFGLSFSLGGLVIGALRPVNTWDLPTYLVLGVAAVIYTSVRYADLFLGRFVESPAAFRKTAAAVSSVLLLVGLAFVFYLPYAQWYVQGYNSAEIWKGDRSPFWSYMTHWGVFLFVIVTWLFWETREWMAQTPVSALNRLRPYQPVIGLAVLFLISAVVVLTIFQVEIAWLVLPLAAWTAVLLLRPGMPDVKRAVLFMVGSALTLTLVVELVVLKGDIERMNTVFKFYLQAWTLLSLSAAVSLVWLWPAVEGIWSRSWRNAWQVTLAVLVFGALLFPVLGGTAKVRDRMSGAAPHTLDGMAYMPYAQYADFDKDMELMQDYMAIRWMQENVQGSPVIVEANTPEYRWGSRYTIYTGLPGVVGWNWHQRQQRSIVPGEWIFNRVEAIKQFYMTTDKQQTIDFLQKYDVKYIVVGQLERAEYAGAGISKFTEWEGELWNPVFQISETTIYEVLP